MTKKIFTGLFCVFFAVFAASSCAKTGGAEKNSVYTNSDLGFKLSYPSSWKHVSLDSLTAFFEAPEKNGFGASFGILVDNEDLEILNKSQEAFAEENGKVIRDFKLISYDRTAFAGSECLITVFDSAGGLGKIRQKQYIFNHGGKLFVLVFTVPQKDYAAFESVFTDIAGSFEFTAKQHF